MKHSLKVTIIVVAILAAVIALPFVALRIATVSPVKDQLLTGIVPKFLNAEVKIDTIDYSIFRTWPNITLRVSGIEVLSNAIEPGDTLATIDVIDVSVNARRFLLLGDVCVDKCAIVRPRAFGRTVGDKSNWDIVVPSEDEDTTESTSEMPAIYWQNVDICNTELYYSSDTMPCDIAVKNINLHTQGEYLTSGLQATLDIDIDSIVYAQQQLQALYTVNNFALRAQAVLNDNGVSVNANIDAPQVALSDNSFSIPHTTLVARLKAEIDTTFNVFDIQTATLSVDDTKLSADGHINLDTINSMYVDARYDVDVPHLEHLFAFVPKQYSKYVKGIRLKGGIGVSGTAKGLYNDKKTPKIKAKLKLKKVNGGAENNNAKIDNLDVDVDASYDQDNKDESYIDIHTIDFKGADSKLKFSGKGCYKESREHIDAYLSAQLNLKQLNQLYPFYEGARVRGTINADINTNFYLDDLINKQIYDIHTQTTVSGDKILFNIPQLRTLFSIDSLRTRISTNTGIQSRRTNTVDTALVNAILSFSSMTIRYRRQIKAEVQRFSVGLYADDIKPNVAPKLSAMVSLRGINAQTHDTTKLKANRISARASVMPNKDHKFLSTAGVSFSFDSIILSRPSSSILLDSTRIKFDATPRYRQYRGHSGGRRQEIPDSQQPVIDLDTLIKIFAQVSKEADFTGAYLKKFTNNGNIYVKRFRVQDPLFPIRTVARNVDVKFTDDTLHLNDFRLRLGRSNLTFTGEVSNIRRYLLRNNTLSADLELKSKRLDLNQLMRAIYQAQSNIPVDTAQASKNMAELQNDDGNDEIDDTLNDSSSIALIAIPNNLDVLFNANIDSVYFSNMQLGDFKGKVRIKDQILSITNLSTSTQIGNAMMNVSYKCPEPTQADVALALNMDRVQIGEILDAMPELDSILPMLRSFAGAVECEISATGHLDSAMNIDLPSVNAGALLRGQQLTLMDGETFSEIAKLLMFNKKTENIIDSVSVELLVKNNEIEIFPFMVAMDKYRVGVGGKQNLDMSFDYHIAVLKPILLGLDIYGTDFDNIKFKLASPRFKDCDTKIGKGGSLIRESDIDIRKSFYNKVLKDIIEVNQ